MDTRIATPLVIGIEPEVDAGIGFGGGPPTGGEGGGTTTGGGEGGTTTGGTGGGGM
jgi:hypothetical protein